MEGIRHLPVMFMMQTLLITTLLCVRNTVCQMYNSYDYKDQLYDYDSDPDSPYRYETYENVDYG